MASNISSGDLAEAINNGTLVDKFSEIMQKAREETGNKHTHSLTVDELERLAKAGVQIDLRNVYIRRDDKRPIYEDRHLLNPLLDRIRRSFQPSDPYGSAFGSFPFRHVSVFSDYADTVYVWVSVGGKPRMFEDHSSMYPSDALMANLHLMIQSKPKDHPKPARPVTDLAINPPVYDIP